MTEVHVGGKHPVRRQDGQKNEQGWSGISGEQIALTLGIHPRGLPAMSARPLSQKDYNEVMEASTAGRMMHWHPEDTIFSE